MLQVSTPSDMKTLASCLNKLTLDGYDENFKVTEKGLEALHAEETFQPDEINIVNFFRFEGPSDPADNSIVYVIETNNGIKGTLTDAYGPYADDEVEEFIKRVEEIAKKTEK